jgi:hypothetical protein
MSNPLHEWLHLIEVSGPFLATPVLEESFPQGLDGLDPLLKKHLRRAYEEWTEAVEQADAHLGELHDAWIAEVLRKGLELDPRGNGEVLKSSEWCAEHIQCVLAEHGATISPSWAIVDPETQVPQMMVQVYAPDIALDASFKLESWNTTPAECMVQLCRATNCRLGLVTNGEQWMLIDAPVGAVCSYASWYARIWSQEPITLQAFVHLLCLTRFRDEASRRLPALLDRSLKHQDEVTDALGAQVSRAVEVLVQSLDRADLDRNRALLRDVKEPELYEAALTVMMRLVFLLSAEEQQLLLLGDERYEANYAVSTLRMHLRKESEEILERRWDAWSRLLAIFRAVYGGIDHENMRLPALGGSLFDPDRFPFLEGRLRGTQWKSDPASPLPIDNRTVLLLLESIQLFEGRTLSYKALDVEQIGYVYEGLLERTVKRTEDVTLELDATAKSKAPLVRLSELEAAKKLGPEKLIALLEERSGSSVSRVKNDLNKAVDERLANRLLTVCQNDNALQQRLLPFAHLVRIDPWGYPLVYPKGAFIVTTGTDRRETGTHYTPKSLTETIVIETLTPVVYKGPSEGIPKSEWVLRTPAELLELKICDPAMGSGAFLVQVCRWLGDRLVESWSLAEGTGQSVSIDGDVIAPNTAMELLPRDTESRTVVARRLIAERCLYGVDINPLGVELAKLSIWLVTLSKGRPFGFLDHNLRSGDSLLGLHRVEQLTELCMAPTGKGQLRLFGQNIESAVREAIAMRKTLRSTSIRDVHDVEVMSQLDANAREKLEVSEHIADGFVGAVLATGGSGTSYENEIATLAAHAGQAVGGNAQSLVALKKRANELLLTDLPAGKPIRRPFHWALEFPEVFAASNGGFDAVVGNPPFLGGQRITGVAGTVYRDWLVNVLAEGRKGSADLVAYFFLRVWSLIRHGGGFGLLAVNTIAEGDTRQVGLEAMVGTGAEIYAAYPNEPWPGKAAVVTSRVHMHKGAWKGSRSLLGRPAPFISAFLSDREEWSPKRLKANEGIAFQGSIVLGKGFVLTHEDAQRMLDADPRNADVIFPYINGDDLNSDPEQKPSRWVINFWDWPEERARAYHLPWKWIEAKVKPERLRLNDTNSSGRRRKQYWWQYGSDAKGLYHAIGRGRFFQNHPSGWKDSAVKPQGVVALSRVSKYLAPSQTAPDVIWSDSLVVFADRSREFFGSLLSSLHEVWVRAYASKLETRLRYTPSDVFETFVRPREYPACLSSIVQQFLDNRSDLCKKFDSGVTDVYNKFHQADLEDSDLLKLRSLQQKIDRAIADAYGWTDLDLGHGFHAVPYLPENDQIRYTISETARVEVLRRLSELNKARYAEEVALGLHDSDEKSSKGPAKKSSPKSNAPSVQTKKQTGFDFNEEPLVSTAAARGNQWGDKATDQILAWLEEHKNWFVRQAILTGCGAEPTAWDLAIKELIADQFVEIQGSGDQARYRAKR